MSKLLVVVGATGQQGRSVIHWFQQNDPSIRIRGLTRTPTSDAAASLASTGVDVVQADLNDFQSLQVAFKGASYIFAYTDTASIIRDLASTGKSISAEQYEETLTPPPPEFYNIEVQQGKNVADAAAEVPELKRLVWSSLANVKSWSGGKYDQVFHFDAKAAVAEYMLEKAELESKVSCVLMGTLLTNAVKGTEIFRCRFVSSPILFPVQAPLDDQETNVGLLAENNMLRKRTSTARRPQSGLRPSLQASPSPGSTWKRTLGLS